MGITFFGAIWLAFLVIFFNKPVKYYVALLIISCVFQATAVVNTETKGFSPFLVTQLFFIIKNVNLIFLFNKKNITHKGFVFLKVFFFSSFLGVCILPIIFEGVRVYSPEFGVDENYYKGGAKLFFSSSNIIQIIYLGINILTLYILSKLKSERLYHFAIQSFLVSILIVVFLGFWEFFDKQFSNLYYPVDFFSNNIGYGLMNDQEYDTGLKRLNSTFIEASFAGGFLAAAFWGIFFIKKLWAKIVAFLIFVALCFNLSGTGLVTFMIGAVVCLYFDKKISYVFYILIFSIIIFFVLNLLGYSDIIINLLFSKSSSQSGIVREGSNDFSFEIFQETKGFGVGLGSHRASSFFFTMLANSGFVLIFLFLYLLIVFKNLLKEIRSYESKYKYSPNTTILFRFGLVYLIAQVLAMPDLSNPSFWSWQFIVFLNVNNNRNDKYVDSIFYKDYFLGKYKMIRNL